ncbi:hypothetical protein CBM2592_B100191 [Cupriavidus taiwanensis]|nr:hypothetical protein CBM2592_B100191 [Cupriavidus taiwanensis]SOZ31638.1 hypothetical protein CBM2608_B90046 [Cupriavidus taiwanensis]SOZ68299.1 hypothetical protein CBM2617_B120001 [Cupriavidus taiwanensis]SOZ84898.1 hypothetical protein CBM2618_B120001 [Cupriavidus taiwanensis]SOZ88126.1 hypothetical protein CBM2622_B130001 [Cupriavidus taiwanensis]
MADGLHGLTIFPLFDLSGYFLSYFTGSKYFELLIDPAIILHLWLRIGLI